MMDTRMAQVEKDVKTILEKMEIADAREQRRGRILDRLVDEEEQRDQLYQKVKSHVIGTGIVGVISMVFAIVWYAAKEFLAK